VDSDFYPTDEEFSRQAVQRISGVPDDVLAFWIKQGLLLHNPTTPRAHRRFGYEQIHIAVVLNAMRSLGANISILRKFAAPIQRGLALSKSARLTYSESRVAVRMAQRLASYQRGDKQEIVGAEWWKGDHSNDVAGSNRAYDLARREPRDEADLIASLKAQEENEGNVQKAAAVAAGWNEEDADCVDWWRDLCMPDILSSGPDFNWVWLAWVEPDGRPRVHGGDDAAPTLTARMPVMAFYISISRLIRPLWADRAALAEEDRRRRQVETRKRRLADLDRTNPEEAARLRKVYGMEA
jgi:DNA-binding transcriptional MerR regulator